MSPRLGLKRVLVVGLTCGPERFFELSIGRGSRRLVVGRAEGVGVRIDYEKGGRRGSGERRDDLPVKAFKTPWIAATLNVLCG